MLFGNVPRDGPCAADYKTFFQQQCPAAVQDLIRQCWGQPSDDPLDQRPTMAAVVAALTKELQILAGVSNQLTVAASLQQPAVPVVAEAEAELKRQHQQEQDAMRLELAKKDAALTWVQSLANTYPNLKFEVTGVEAVKPTAVHAGYAALKELVSKEPNVVPDDLKDRWVFHTTPDPDVIPLICANTLRPSLCERCKSGGACNDPGIPTP